MMHSRLIIFIWRRKILVLSSSLLFLVAIWCWGLFYTTSSNEDTKMTIKELEENKDNENLFHRLGLSSFHLGSYDKPKDSAVRFVKPTGSSTERSKKDKRLNPLDTLMLDKDTEKLLRNLEMPTRDEIAKRRAGEEQKLAAEKESHYEHELHRMGIPNVAGLGPGGHPPLNQRLVHFDLKGAPPKVSYLKRLMPILKSLGATGILLEYEDMFPYSGNIAEISAKNSYSEKEIKELLHSAASVDLSVMPLVQTFGHLEFALKLKEFQHLREVEESPQALCPSLNTSMVFIEQMITQIVKLHSPVLAPGTTIQDDDIQSLIPSFTHLHIGCDEVYRMAECPRCRMKARDELFLSHVGTIARMVKKKWPHLKIVIWDDMLRHMSLTDIQDSKIGSLVEPMVWVYAEDIYRFIGSQTWDKYATVFQTAWVASAFKGAHGETLMIPPARRHLENTLKWLAVSQGEGARFSKGIQGIALTGWQRYDHFAVLCELLPVALPSLAICLSTASKGYFDIDAKKNPILSALTCPEPSMEILSRRPWLDMHKDPNLSTFARCMFPGSALFRFVGRFIGVEQEAREYINTVKEKRGWLTSYNIRHNFSSPSRVDELIQDSARLSLTLTHMAKNAADSMFDIFDHYTIYEFIEQRIYPILNELKTLENKANELKLRKVWPKRPLPYSKQLEKYELLPTEKSNKVF